MAKAMDWRSTVSSLCNLFAVWVALASAVALRWPESFAWCTPVMVTRSMSALSFLVGMTTKPKEFRACLSRPRPVTLNLVCCFVFMPLVALALAKGSGLSEDHLVGLVLLGGVNGGSTSNLCALIAGVDVPLSVLMTASSTLAAAVGTPLVTKLFLGTIVPVDSFGILMSALKVVLFPVFLGVASSAVAPRACGLVAPGIPLLGVSAGVLIIGAIVSGSAELILSAGWAMHLCVVLLHVSAGAMSYGLAVLLGSGTKECRTLALEVAMKNCAFASVLAAAHFEAAAVRTPSAASCIWCPMLASTVSVYWKMRPTKEGGGGTRAAGDVRWADGYKA